MRIDAEDLTTGERFTGEAEKLTEDDIAELRRYRFAALDGAERDVDRLIDNLDNLPGVNADKWAEARRKLKEMSKAVIHVGGVVIHVGRKLLDCVLYAFREYPGATFGAIFGLIVGVLISAIPVIGFLFGGLMTIILPLIGGVRGYIEDLHDKALKRTIQEEICRFEALKTSRD